MCTDTLEVGQSKTDAVGLRFITIKLLLFKLCKQMKSILLNPLSNHGPVQKGTVALLILA